MSYSRSYELKNENDSVYLSPTMIIERPQQIPYHTLQYLPRQAIQREHQVQSPMRANLEDDLWFLENLKGSKGPMEVSKVG
jgi:hypothetical protein